jgi:hypothetical protein
MEIFRFPPPPSNKSAGGAAEIIAHALLVTHSDGFMRELTVFSLTFLRFLRMNSSNHQAPRTQKKCIQH